MNEFNFRSICTMRRPGNFIIPIGMMSGVHSKYLPITERKPGSVPCATIIAGVDYFWNAQASIADSPNYTIAECRTDETIAVFNKNTGAVYAAILGEDESLESYVIDKPSADNGRHCEAVFLALLPSLYKDEEFEENYNACKTHFMDKSKEIPHDVVEKATIMSDNVYARLDPTNKGLASFLFVDYDSNLQDVTPALLKAAKKDAKLWGNSSDFSYVDFATPSDSGSADNKLSFRLNGVDPVVSEDMQHMVPTLPDWYKVPEFVKDILKHCSASEYFRIISLLGGAGSGKSEAAKAVAAILKLPFCISTIHAGCEISDLLGTYKPDPAKPGTFKFVEMPAMKVIREGGVWEIQEVNSITRPGELVGLNGLLDAEGTFTLPTGEVVKRHPDCIVFMTSNVGYEGTRQMNQALFDRSHMILNVETPSIKEMVSRVKDRTGFTGTDSELTEMAQIVTDMAAMMQDQGMSEGTCGMRALIAWAMSVNVTKNIYDSFMLTVLPRCTPHKEDQDFLKKRILESSFAPKKRGRKI